MAEKKHESVKAFEPETFVVSVIISILSAIICMQIIARIGTTPNTSVIGALMAMAIARIPLKSMAKFRSLDRQNLVQTMAARQLGAPVSLETIHGYLADQGLTSLTFNDEMEKMKAEIEKYPFILELGGKADQNAQQQAQGNKVNAGGTQQPSQKQS